MVFHVIDRGRVWPARAYVSDCVSKALNRWRYLWHFGPSEFISFSHNYYLSTQCDMVNVQPIIVPIFHFGVHLIGQKSGNLRQPRHITSISHIFILSKYSTGKPKMRHDPNTEENIELECFDAICHLYLHVLIRMIVLSISIGNNAQPNEDCEQIKWAIRTAIEAYVQVHSLRNSPNFMKEKHSLKILCYWPTNIFFSHAFIVAGLWDCSLRASYMEC